MYGNLFREQTDPSSFQAYVVPAGQLIVSRTKLQWLLILELRNVSFSDGQNVDAELQEGLLPQKQKATPQWRGLLLWNVVGGTRVELVTPAV